MSLHPLVFSNNRQYRLARHALFWTGWILYYSVITCINFSSTIGYGKGFLAAITEVTLSTPLDMCFCYFVIYFLLPKFLYRGQYVSMLLLWLLASFVFMVLFELNVLYALPHIRGWFGLPKPSMPRSYIWVFFDLFGQINMEGCVAASIKLGKLWYIKQQEIDLLKEEKEKIKPLEEKGLMQPAFLSDLLSRIEILADTKPLVVARSIKEIRNLLTYMLYENAQAKVLLNKELKLAKEYIELEKMIGHENITVLTDMDVAASSEQIAPFILLPLIENAFLQLYQQPLSNKRIDITIKLHQGILHTKITWNKPMDTSTLSSGRNIILQNMSKRLQLIYPQSHELKFMLEVEKVIITLKVDLKKAIN